MPDVSNVPEKLRAYVAHGVELNYESASDQATGNCPWCGSEGKFYVDKADGLWNCRRCGEGSDKGGGNAVTFVRLLWDKSADTTSDKDLQVLAAERKLLSAETLRTWGVRKSAIDGAWIAPGYTVWEGKPGNLVNVYRYVWNAKEKRFAWYSTPGLMHGIYYPGKFDPKKPILYITEGVWDGMALWEVLNNAKQRGERDYTITSSPIASLGSFANVISTPGCNTFFDQWLPVCGRRKVRIMFDSDHPQVHPKSGKSLGSPAHKATKRLASSLYRAEQPRAAEVDWLKWGPEGYDPTLPHGYDLRDALAKSSDGKSNTLEQRVRLLGGVLARLASANELVQGGDSTGAGRSKEVGLEPAECTSWRELHNSWRKAMKWTDGLDRALSVMLAAVTSTMTVGDQLWFKVIGPAACGKSTLCEALAVNKTHVIARSTITGFHSGFDSSGHGEEDNSLIRMIRNKTLVTKDGDTLMSSPNVKQVLAEARDVYDRTSRSYYRNKAGRSQENINMTWILCGTSALRWLDSSELGERFLDCVIMEGILEELEDDILWRTVNSAFRDIKIEANGNAANLMSPEKTEAYQLTGGYINYLRDNAFSLLEEVQVSESVMQEIMRYAKFVSYLRARPSSRQIETAEREFSTRLTSQLLRTAMCLAVVLNRNEVDEEVMRRVRQVALDTARGRTLTILNHLWNNKGPSSRDGLETRGILALTGQPKDSETTLLHFLQKIGAVEQVQFRSRGVRQQPRWRMTTSMLALYESVLHPIATNGVIEEELEPEEYESVESNGEP